jgi:hypothetical protein
MKKVKLHLDCYDIFDRPGEDVLFRFVVNYDWGSILKNDINGDNFQVEMIGFDEDVDVYFSAYRISRDAWAKEAQDYLMKNDCETVKEIFFEQLSDDMYREYEAEFFNGMRE